MARLRRLARSLRKVNVLADENVRQYWVYARAFYFIRLRRALLTMESKSALEATIQHNMRSLFSVNRRMDILLRPLSVIETLNQDSKFLIIGPRNENDIFTLASLGFPLQNIRGLDLISYSPRIVLGDMHQMPFDDEEFDAIICGWTLSYSIDPRAAALEMCRVARPGAIVAIAVEYSTMTPEDERELVGYAVQDGIHERVNSTHDILTLFGDGVADTYFVHDAPNKRSHRAAGLVENVSSVAVVFRLASGKRV